MPKLYEDDYRNVGRDDIAAALTQKAAPWQASLGEIGKPFAATPGVPSNQMAQGAAPPVPQYSVPMIGDTLRMGGMLEQRGKRPMGGMQMQYMRRF